MLTNKNSIQHKTAKALNKCHRVFWLQFQLLVQTITEDFL